jgi:hypothetical protein
MTNAAPPNFPTMYGKRQTAPSPTATPIMVIKRPKLEAKVSLFWLNPVPFKIVLV